MIVECKQCGAPLEVTPDAFDVRCVYCRAVNRVRRMRTLHFERPPGWKAPETWTAVARKSEAPPRRPAEGPPRLAPRRKSRIRPLLILAALAVVAAIALWDTRWIESLSFFGLDEGAAPQVETIDLVETPVTVRRNAAGRDVCSTTCATRGTKPRQTPRPPSVEASTSPEVALESDEVDLTLLVRNPDGSVTCDDDSGEGHDPRIQDSWPPGSHQVWVGSFRRAPEPHELRLSASGG